MGTSPTARCPLLDNSFPPAMSQKGPCESSLCKMMRVRSPSFPLDLGVISPGSPKLGHGLGSMCKSAVLLFLAFGGVR